MSGAEVSIRPSTIYISPSYDPYSQSIYTSSPTSFTRPTSIAHEISKPVSSSASRQSSALSRPSTIYTSANIAQSFKVIRRQRTRKSNTSRRDTRNVLNQTLDNFYNILRRTKTDQTIKSARTWVNEYENYRRSVIYEEKEYEKYRSSLMMLDGHDNIYGNGSPCKSSTYDTSYSYRNSMYERSPPCKSFTTYENHSSSPYLRGASPGATEKRINGISAINGRRQLSKNSVGVEGHKVGEPLYSNYF